MSEEAATTETTTNTNEEEKAEKKSCAEKCKNLGPKDYLKILFVIFLLTFFTLAIVYNDVTSDVFSSFLGWMEDNPFLGGFVYIFIYTATTVLVIPGSLLTLGAGFVYFSLYGGWGVLVATLVVMLGATSGATLAFVLAKSLLRDVVVGLKKKYPTFDTIDKVVEIFGLRVTFLLRLSPAIPFNAFNYLMGLTSVKLRDYVIACIGMLPGTIAYCFIGSTLGSLADTDEVSSNPITLILLIVGTAVTLVGMIVLSIYAKKKYVELRDKVIAQSDKDGMDKPKIQSGDGDGASNVEMPDDYNDGNNENNTTNETNETNNQDTNQNSNDTQENQEV